MPGTRWTTGECRECAGRFGMRQAEVPMGDRTVLIPPMRPTCPICDEAARHAATAAEDDAEALRRSMLLDGEVPKLYREATLERVADVHPGLAAAMDEWISEATEGGRNGLFLYGGYGAGKTYAAIAFLRDALLRGTFRDVAFANVVDVIDDTFAGMRDRDHRPRFNLDRLKRVPLLVLDDLGAESPTPYVKARIYGLVNARIVDPNLVTIYTSNDRIDAIGRSAGGRVASRIEGSCRLVELTGEDLRRARGGNR